MHFYYDNSGQIVMRSEAPIDAPQFKHIELDISEEEEKKLQENWRPRVEKKKLHLEMPDWKRSEIEKQERDDVVEAIKEKIKKQKDDNTKNVLNDILNLVKK